MEFEEFLQAVRKRRSTRKLKPDPIPDGYAEKICETARWAMSGANGQPWEFIIVKDPETKKKITELFVEERKRIYAVESTRVEEYRMPAYPTLLKEVPSSAVAPVLIVVCGDPRTYQASVLWSHFSFGEGGAGACFYKNMANATQLLCLAASVLGLGAQWCSITMPMEIQLKQLLKVPPEMTVPTIVPIGYPAYKTPPPYRRKLSEILHYEEYDQSKARTGDDINKFLLKLRSKTREAYTKGI